jgi:hypothetical protein
MHARFPESTCVPNGRPQNMLCGSMLLLPTLTVAACLLHADIGCNHSIQYNNP